MKVFKFWRCFGGENHEAEEFPDKFLGEKIARSLFEFNRRNQPLKNYGYCSFNASKKILSMSKKSAKEMNWKNIFIKCLPLGLRTSYDTLKENAALVESLGASVFDLMIKASKEHLGKKYIFLALIPITWKKNHYPSKLNVWQCLCLGFTMECPIGPKKGVSEKMNSYARKLKLLKIFLAKVSKITSTPPKIDLNSAIFFEQLCWNIINVALSNPWKNSHVTQHIRKLAMRFEFGDLSCSLIAEQNFEFFWYLQYSHFLLVLRSSNNVWKNQIVLFQAFMVLKRSYIKEFSY